MMFKILLLACCILTLQKTMAQAPAQSVPAFSFQRLDNTSFTNENLANGGRLFFVFFDIECEHCRHAMGYINQHASDFETAAVYLISLESSTAMKSFLKTYGSGLLSRKNVTLLRDAKNEFIQKFSPRKYPSLFLYSAKKTLLLYDDDEQNLYKFSAEAKKG